MKFGVREICDVVLRAKARQQIGNKIFYKNEPVMYFDTLKTSSMEGTAQQVYANGGRGNARLVSWEGERTVTFTMEDALISAEGFMILSGAGLVEATNDKPIYQHMTETVDKNDPLCEFNGTSVEIPLSAKPFLPDDRGDNFAYVMFMRDGEIVSEPYIPVHGSDAIREVVDEDTKKVHYIITVQEHPCYDDFHETAEANDIQSESNYLVGNQLADLKWDSVLVDFYTARTAAAKQVEITPDKFGGNFYLEASTLFRTEQGIDMPAEFVIPNCKIQSNFTFTMASSGDPSSFTFTMDAFPDYTRFDHSKKVLAAIQIIEDSGAWDYHRGETPVGVYDADGITDDRDRHETQANRADV